MKPITIAIASQKGGCGKSAITTLMANILCFDNAKKVTIFDLDAPQFSTHKVRNSELDTIKYIHAKIEGDHELTKLEEELWRKFSITYSSFPNYIHDFRIEYDMKGLRAFHDIMKKLPSCDFVFFDTVGTLANKELISIIESVDFVFVPVETEERALIPGIASLDAFKKIREQKGKKHTYGILNKFKAREVRQLESLKKIAEASAKLSLPFLFNEDGIPHYIEDRAVFRNTTVISSSIQATLEKTLIKTEGYAALKKMIELVTQ